MIFNYWLFVRMGFKICIYSIDFPYLSLLSYQIENANFEHLSGRISSSSAGDRESSAKRPKLEISNGFNSRSRVRGWIYHWERVQNQKTVIYRLKNLIPYWNQPLTYFVKIGLKIINRLFILRITDYLAKFWKKYSI